MQKFEKWMAIAEREIQAAESAGQAGFYAEACFWCQQSIEKALKGLISAKGKEFTKTHSLIGLAKQAEVINELRDLISDLDTDYAATRYVVVNDLEDEDLYDKKRFEERFQAAIKALELIRKWIKN